MVRRTERDEGSGRWFRQREAARQLRSHGTWAAWRLRSIDHRRHALARSHRESTPTHSEREGAMLPDRMRADAVDRESKVEQRQVDARAGPGRRPLGSTQERQMAGA